MGAAEDYEERRRRADEERRNYLIKTGKTCLGCHLSFCTCTPNHTPKLEQQNLWGENDA